MKLLSCKNLSVGYEGNIVQKDINLEINSGDYLCVVGKNGAGKTTFMKTILGLIPPISGEYVLMEGINTTDIGYLPQQTIIQKDFPASVLEVALSGNINKHGKRFFYTKEEKQKTDAMLEKVGILHLKNKSYSKLSGGQQQRVLLARALCATNKVILLDEPLAGLDTETGKELYNIIQKLNSEGITVIMITHELENALQYANLILTLDETATLVTKQQYIEDRELKR